MSRVATIPMQKALYEAIRRGQENLARSQAALASGKKAQDYAALGTDAIRNVSAHSMIARQDAEAAVGTRLQSTLSAYDTNISGMESSADSLRISLLSAVGTGGATGLQEAIDAAFSEYRSLLNGSEGGVPLFAGAQTDADPFKPAKLADLSGLDASDAFGDDDVRVSARVSEGVDMTYGITARQVGGGLYDAFRTLAEAGTIGDTPTPAQMSALNDAVGQLGTGLTQVRGVNAENGHRQSQLETLMARRESRSVYLSDIVSQNEDADLAQVASDIVRQQTLLQASYSVFAKLSGLSLVDYLR